MLALDVKQCTRLQGALDWHPAPKPLLEAAILARERSAARGVDIGTLAIKEAVKPQGIAVTLIGMRTPEEVCHAPGSQKVQ